MSGIYFRCKLILNRIHLLILRQSILIMAMLPSKISPILVKFKITFSLFYLSINARKQEFYNKFILKEHIDICSMYSYLLFQ